MAHIRLPCVYPVPDRHGRPLWYWRKPGFKNVRLHGEPGSPQFMADYARALASTPAETGAPKAPATAASKNTRKGITVAQVVGLYLASPRFAGLAKETRRTQCNVLERFREGPLGVKPIADVTRDDIADAIEAKDGRPSAQQHLHAYVRAVMQFAVKRRFRADNPAVGVTWDKPQKKSKGFPTWNEDEIAIWEAAYPPGTRGYLALALLLGTAQRRGDIVRLGWPNVQGNRMCLTQSKTGKALRIPIGVELRRAIEATPRDRATFLAGPNGLPLTPESFTNWMRRCAKAAGLPHGLSAHGLRKAACRRLAEAGCTPHEIMSYSGHVTLREVSVYTSEVDQEQLAEKALRRLVEAQATNRLRVALETPPDYGFDINKIGVCGVGGDGLEPPTLSV
jgi:integrase